MKLRAPDHQGMRVDYRGMLRQAREALDHEVPGGAGRIHAEMLRQLTDHLTEMGERFYAGDVAAVDELLQLYCIAREGRATPPPVDTEQAIQTLARDLPEGYSVALDVERGSGSVTLHLPGAVGLEDIHSDEGTMGEQLLDALARAKELAGGS